MATVEKHAALTVGIHDNVPADRYHADPCERPSLSSSLIKVLCSQSPLHAWTQHPKLNPEYESRDTPEFDVGTAAHSILLNGEDIVEIIDADSFRTNAAKEARDDARHAGRVPLLTHQAAQVNRMLSRVGWQLDRVRCEPRPFTDGAPEQTLIWEDDYGVICRARPDWLRTDCVAIDDYKTTTTANPDRWSRKQMFDNGYDVQAAFYLRGLRKLTGADAEFRFVVQEKTPPFALTVISLGGDVLAVADAKIEWALRKWSGCLASDSWPAYTDELYRAELPAWADDARWLTDESEEEG